MLVFALFPSFLCVMTISLVTLGCEIGAPFAESSYDKETEADALYGRNMPKIELGPEPH